jgi:hypothetical protein
VREHARERRGVLLDVEVFERDMPPLKVVTGGLRVGSGVFAEDEDHEALSHYSVFHSGEFFKPLSCTSTTPALHLMHI